jgi:hypothetical protein
MKRLFPVERRLLSLPSGPSEPRAWTAQRDRDDMIPAMLAEEKMEKIEPAEPTDRIEPNEPIDRTEPTEPIDKTDPTEPIDKIEPAEPIDSTDRCEPIESGPVTAAPMPAFSQRYLIRTSAPAIWGYPVPGTRGELGPEPVQARFQLRAVKQAERRPARPCRRRRGSRSSG